MFLIWCNEKCTVFFSLMFYCNIPILLCLFFFFPDIPSSFGILKEKKKKTKNKQAKKARGYNMFLSTSVSHTIWVTILHVLPNTKYSQRSNQYLKRHFKWKWAASHLYVLSACRFYPLSKSVEMEPENKTCKYWLLCILECKSGAKVFHYLLPIPLTVIKTWLFLCSMYIQSYFLKWWHLSLFFSPENTNSMVQHTAYLYIIPAVSLVFLCLVSLFISILQMSLYPNTFSAHYWFSCAVFL